MILHRNNKHVGTIHNKGRRLIAALFKHKNAMIIDLSSNNGKVDFAKLEDIDEVFVRSSLGYGDFDKKLNDNARATQSVGIPVSYYHFAYPHTGNNPVADAMKQANYFCDTIKNLPDPAHLAVDLENFNAQGGDTTISKTEYQLWLQAFLDTVEARTGIKCIIYTYADYLNRHLPANHTFWKYPLWIANYGTQVQHPPLPNGWTTSWAWQYSESGEMAGIDGHVDLSKTT